MSRVELPEPLPPSCWDTALEALEADLDRIPWSEWQTHWRELFCRVAGVPSVRIHQHGPLPATLQNVSTGRVIRLTSGDWSVLTGVAWGWRLEDDSWTICELSTKSASLPVDADACLYALSELASDAARRRALQIVTARSTAWTQRIERGGLLQPRESLAAAGRIAVAELREAFQAERVILMLTDRRQQTKLVAVSGVSSPEDHPTEFSEQLIELAPIIGNKTSLYRLGEAPACLPETTTELPPALLQWWDRYSDQSTARGAWLIGWQAVWSSEPGAAETSTERMLRWNWPAGLKSRLTLKDETAIDESVAPVAGLVMLEWFRSDEKRLVHSGETLPAALSLQLALTPVEIARRTESIPGARWWRKRLDRPPGGSRRALWMLFVASLLIFAACWPVTLKINASGRVWPRERREIFAPEDAVIRAIHVISREKVVVDAPLLTLTALELEQEQTRLRGETATTEKRLAALAAERLQLNDSSEEARRRAEQLTGEEAECLARRESLRKQNDLINQRLTALNLRSPIAGQVLNWDPRGEQLGKPVRRGQPLLTIADIDGPWVVELRIALRDLEPIATACSDQPPMVEIRSALDPTLVLGGQLTTLGERGDIDPVWGAGVHAVVAIHDRSHQLLPGTEARVSIPCGKRPLVYVLFRDLIDAVRRWW